MPITHSDGRIRSDAEAHEMIRETIRRCGRFLLAADERPRIGEVQEFAGLPIRMVRFVTAKDYKDDLLLTVDIWGEPNSKLKGYFFEVEVAD